MEFDAQQILNWVAAIFLAAVGWFLLKQRSQHHAYTERRHEPRYELDELQGRYDEAEAGPSKLSTKLTIWNWNINFDKGMGGTATMLCMCFLALLATDLYSEQPAETPASDKGKRVSSHAASLTGPLLIGLDYEINGYPELALTAYNEALDENGNAPGARAFISNRIAVVRFAQRRFEEALERASLAVELAGPQPLYVHTLARIRIQQCELDEAKEALDQISGGNPATDDLRQTLLTRRQNRWYTL
jgi:tetratricopeptide (TPR) repeat protein